MIHDSRFTVHDSRFAIRDLRLTIWIDALHLLACLEWDLSQTLFWNVGPTLMSRVETVRVHDSNSCHALVSPSMERFLEREMALALALALAYNPVRQRAHSIGIGRSGIPVLYLVRDTPLVHPTCCTDCTYLAGKKNPASAYLGIQGGTVCIASIARSEVEYNAVQSVSEAPPARMKSRGGRGGGGDGPREKRASGNEDETENERCKSASASTASTAPSYRGQCAQRALVRLLA